MALNRRTALAQLKTTLEEITEIKTVVRSYGGRTVRGAADLESFDITNYTSAQLPLIEIQEPAEDTEQQNTSMRAIMALELILKLWFVSWPRFQLLPMKLLLRK